MAPLAASWFLGVVFLALDGRRRWVAIVGAACLALVCAWDIWLLTLLMARDLAPQQLVTGNWPTGVGIGLQVDELSLATGATCAVVLSGAAVHHATGRDRSRLLPSLLLFMAAGLHGAFFTADLFNFYVFFELSVVTSFALAAFGYGRAEVRGTLVYVAVNLFGSVLFLFAVATMYGARGTLAFAALSAQTQASGGTELLAATLLFAALAIKMGLFPFHGWLPVLYSHARPVVAAVMSGALVNIGIYGLLRLGFSVFDEQRAVAAWVLLILGGIAMLYGALVALSRQRPSEFAAYAAIMQAGYVVLALGLGGPSAPMAVVLVVFAGSIDKATMFFATESKTPWRGVTAFVAAASTAGLPLSLGFLAKLFLFRAALEQPTARAVFASSVLLLSTAITLVAAMRFYRLVRPSHKRQKGRSSAALALAAVTIALGIWAQPLLRVARETSVLLDRSPEVHKEMTTTLGQTEGTP